MSFENFKKKDTYETIVNAGFDIKENAKWLKDFYVEALKEAGENNQKMKKQKIHVGDGSYMDFLFADNY